MKKSTHYYHILSSNPHTFAILVHSLSLLGKQYDLVTNSRAPKLSTVLAQPALAYSS